MDDKNEKLIAECGNSKNLIRYTANGMRSMPSPEFISGYILKKSMADNTTRGGWKITMETPYPEAINYDTALRMIQFDLQNGVAELFKPEKCDKSINVSNISIFWNHRSPFWTVTFHSNLWFSDSGKLKALQIEYSPKEISNKTLVADLKELRHGLYILSYIAKNKSFLADSALIEKRKDRNDRELWDNLVRSEIDAETPPDEAKKQFLIDLGGIFGYKLHIQSYDLMILANLTFPKLYPEKSDDTVWYIRFRTRYELKATRSLPDNSSDD